MRRRFWTALPYVVCEVTMKYLILKTPKGSSNLDIQTDSIKSDEAYEFTSQSEAEKKLEEIKHKKKYRNFYLTILKLNY